MSADPIHVLLVEDDAAHAEAIRRAFESAAEPVAVRVASSLAAFRAAAAERVPHVALMDLNLSDGRADDVLRLLASLDGFPVVVMTSFGDESTAAAAIKAGALDYIVKSSEAFAQLPQRVDRVLREWAIRQDRARAHAALREREALYRAVIETAADGFWMTDTNGRILEVNEAYVRMSGYSRAELLAMRVSDLEARESPEETAAHMAALLQSGSDIFETQHRKKDGTVWQVEIDTAAWPIEDGRCFVFIRDIARRRRDQFLLRLRAQIAGEAGGRSVDELLQFALDQMELLTGSSIGFFHFVDPDQEHLRLQTWSTRTLATMCTAEGKGLHYPISSAGVWADCMRERKPLIHNDYASVPNKKGMPEGHASVVRELVVPVISGGKALAVCGVGNKTADYTADDVEAVEGIASMVTDLALRRQTQEQFEQFFGLVPDLVCIANSDGRFLRLNDTWEAVLGYPKAELMSRPWTDFVHPDDLPGTIAQVAEQMAGGRTIGFVNRYRCKDGSYRALEWVATPAVDGILYAAARDVTRRKAAEAEMVRSKQWVDLHLKNTPLAVIEWDTDLNVREWNPAAERIFGYSRDEIVGRHFLTLVPESSWEALRHVGADLLANRGGLRSTNPNVTKDGRGIICDWFNTTLVDPDGRTIGVASLVLDVTAQHQLEAQLRQTQRMEAVGQLAGGVAHDYNNILAAMMMHLGLLKERLGLPSDVRQTVEDVHKLAERSAALTRQLLMFSRRSVLAIKTIDLNRVVTDLVKMLRRLIGEHVAFEFVAEPRLPSVQADSGMMEQVFTNLCVNARDAMPKGGRLTVWTSVHDIDPERAARHPDARVGRFVCLSVRDTGTGMTDEVRQRIFEPFFTTKEAGKGTGLGLATVFGIVKQHNGWIEVDSHIGAGSTFRVFLPADAAEAESLAVADKPRARGGTETILVVEDEEAVRRTVTLVLRRFGYRVLQAANGPEALEVWTEEQSSIALLFTDMVMPGGLSGLDLADQFRRDKPDLKVIISSGYSGDLVGSAATSDTELVFVPKPVASDDLVRIVRDTLDGKPPA